MRNGNAIEPSVPFSEDEGLGLPLILMLVYLWVEYARPGNPMKIPLIISILLLVNWTASAEKKWSPQATCFLVLLGIIAATGTFASNTYAAWWGFVAMTVQLVFICIPMMTFISSLRRLTMFINTLLAVFAYVAVYGLLNGGRGPGGHIGDENDLALALNMVIPYAYMSMFLAESVVQKVVFLSTFGLMVATVIATFSRGGFLGLLAMLFFCLLVSPKKAAAFTLAVILAVVAVSYAPSAYWNRVSTIVDEANDPAIGTGALRRQFWAIAREMFYQNPILGVGFDNFRWSISAYEPPDQMSRVGHSYSGTAVHSVYFSVLAELGLSGALTFLVILGYNLRDMNRVVSRCAEWKKQRPPPGETGSSLADEDAVGRDVDRAMNYGRAMQASVIGFLVSGIFLSAFDYPHFWILTALVVALKKSTATVLTGIDAEEGERPEWPSSSGRDVAQMEWWRRERNPHNVILAGDNR